MLVTFIRFTTGMFDHRLTASQLRRLPSLLVNITLAYAWVVLNVTSAYKTPAQLPPRVAACSSCTGSIA